jgi:hypothetical protein
MIRGLEAHEFERVLKSAKFTERVCDLAAFTLKHSTEGGLAVYKNLKTAKLSISKVDTPDVEKMREDVELGILDIWNYQTSSEKQLTYSGAVLFKPNTRVYRRDIALELHSHPTDQGKDPLYHLRPSAFDLDGTELLSGHSPNSVSAILVPYRDTANVMFYRQTPSFRNGAPVELEYLIDDSREKTLGVMANYGYSFVDAVYNLKTRQLTSDPAKLTHQLFV